MLSRTFAARFPATTAPIYDGVQREDFPAHSRVSESRFKHLSSPLDLFVPVMLQGSRRLDPPWAAFGDDPSALARRGIFRLREATMPPMSRFRQAKNNFIRFFTFPFDYARKAFIHCIVTNKGNKMNRQPQYTKDNLHRMISVANGLWRVQRFENVKGTSTFDPRGNVGPAVDRATAVALLNSHEPIKRPA